MRPIFETPRLDDLEPTEGAQRGFFGSVAAGWEAQRSFDNFNSEAFLRDRVWRDYIDEIEQRTGDRLPHPDDFIPEIDLPIMLGASDEEGGGVAGAKARFVLARIDELRDQNPELNIPGPEWMAERLMAEAERVEVEESRAGGLGLFVGRLGGAITDPATIVTAPVGGGQKTVLRAAGVEAAVNGLLEMANIPVANRWREELGVDTMTLEEGAQSVAVAAVAGGILGGAGRFAETEIPRAFNRLSNSRLAAALRDLSGGNPDRLELAEALAREADVEGQNPFPPSGADLHEERLQDALTAITETDAARAGAAMDRLLEDVPPPAAGSAALPSGLSEIDPRTLEVDAARFQFKDGGDSEGVTDRLAGVTEWDPVRAGISLVFEQEDGARFIVDGHQRRGLAARLLEEDPEADIRLTAFVYREADGWADAEIRAIAAAKNLAEGTGTAIDAAKILRADPDLLDGSLPTRGALIRDAQGLMRLGDDAFGAVVNEVVPANFAAIVGRIIDDPAEQVAVIEQIARAEVRNAIEAEALVRGAQAAGFARREGETGSLFGDLPTESLIVDRARILSRAISILRKEKGVFTTLAREADRIENAGNRLARDTNQERARTDAALLDILQTLAHRSGPVADALNARVRDANGNFAAGARAFVGDLRDLTSSGDLSRVLDGGSRREVDPAAPGERGGDAPVDDGARAPVEDPDSEDGLRGLIDSGAAADEIAEHPIVKAALEDAAARPSTSDLFDFDSAAYVDGRQFVTPDGDLAGVDALLDYHRQHAARLAWADDGLPVPAEGVGYDRELTFVIGYPAAGKSSVANPVARTRRAAILDADEIKKTIPEYDNGRGAAAVHRESSILSMQLFEDMLEDGVNIVWPKVGGRADRIASLADRARENGYDVNIVWMDTPQPEAMRRMVSRGLSTGRFIPPQLIGVDRLAFKATYDYMADAGRSRHAVHIDGSPPKETGPQILNDQGGFLDQAELQAAPSSLGDGASPVSARSGRSGGGSGGLASDAREQGLGRPQGEAPGEAEAELDELFDADLIFEPGEVARRGDVSRADVEAEIAADEAAVDRLRGCVPK